MTPETQPDNIETLQTRKLHLETEKLVEEREKLKIETRLLKRPWFLQAGYIAAILPIFAVSVTAVITYMNSDLRRETAAAKQELQSARVEKSAIDDEVAKARNELNDLMKAVDQERSRRQAIEQQLAPRTLSDARRARLKASLQPYSGHSITVALQGESEARGYGEVLIHTLQGAGWTVNLRPFSTIISPRYGLMVLGPDISESALKTLVVELVKCGNPVYFAKSGDPYDYMEVNLKPRFGADPRLMLTDFDPRSWSLPPRWVR
jgi:hypothetical protein